MMLDETMKIALEKQNKVAKEEEERKTEALDF